MDIILLIVGILCLLVGLAGAVLPLPGPPLSFIGILALNYSKFAYFSTSTLTLFGILTVGVVVLDYYVPIWGTQKFGGSKWGSWGAGIGLLAGFLLGPLGILVGPFVGAFIGEYSYSKNPELSFKAALGSVMGLMAGIIVKVILCLVMLIYAAVEIISNL